MVFIRPDEREINFKIVLWGPPCSGKTTFLSSLRAQLTAPKSAGKTIPSPDRTLFFDFLPLKVDKIKNMAAHFHLYTVPGQAPYQDSRSLLLRGVDGVVVVLDSQIDRSADNRQCLDELQAFLDAMGESLTQLPLIFVYNKQDTASALTPDDMNQLYNPHHLPAFPTVAAKGAHVAESFSALIEKVVAHARTDAL